MRLPTLLLALSFGFLIATNSLHAEERSLNPVEEADLRASNKALSDQVADLKEKLKEVDELKAKLKDMEGRKLTAQVRTDIFKKGFEKLLDIINSQESLLKMRDEASKIELKVTEDHERLDKVLNQGKPE